MNPAYRTRIVIVVAATPIDLAALIALDKPVVRARYEFADSATPGLAAELDRFVAGLRRR
jgi:predicted GTPase